MSGWLKGLLKEIGGKVRGTGGGNSAVVVQLGGDRFALVTDADDTQSLPREGREMFAGVYEDEEGANPIDEHYAKTVSDLKAFLKKKKR